MHLTIFKPVLTTGNSIKQVALILLIICHACLGFAQPAWKSRPDLPRFRYQAVAFGIRNYGYVCTGIDRGILYSDLWRYDPENSIWKEMEPIPSQGRGRAVSFTINNCGYVLCGVVGDSSDWGEVWEYNIDTGHWTKKARFPLEFACCNEDLIGFGLMNKGYVYSNEWARLYCFDPITNTWTRLSDSPIPSTGYRQGFTIKDKFFLGLGFRNADYSRDFWEYNPSSDTWKRLADFPGSGRGGAVSFSINDQGYFGLGNNKSRVQYDFWTYKPESDSWKQIDSLNYNADYAVGMSIGDKGYVGTGLPYSVGPCFWEFTTKASFVGPFEKQNPIKIFPIPVQTNLFIENGLSPIEFLEITSISGICMKSFYSDAHSIDVSDLYPGIYILKIRCKEGISMHKFIKE